jgi:electron transport complex protein RnfD
VLVGHVAGGIGSLSAPLLLIGSWYLLSRGVIRWHLPVFYIGTFFLLAEVFGGLGEGKGWFAGGPVFQLLSGSLVLGAFYAAPDPVTSPLTDRGKCIYGIGLGVLTFFMRYYGSLGDGVATSIILGNCAAPLLDRWELRRKNVGAGERTA